MTEALTFEEFVRLCLKADSLLKAIKARSPRLGGRKPRSLRAGAIRYHACMHACLSVSERMKETKLKILEGDDRMEMKRKVITGLILTLFVIIAFSMVSNVSPADDDEDEDGYEIRYRGTCDTWYLIQGVHACMHR